MKVLVVGGAGYIGSHMVQRLNRDGGRVTVLDDLSAGHADSVRNVELIVGDLGDSSVTKPLLRGGAFDAVMHFASFIQVGESVREPQRYYDNNLVSTIALLDQMLATGVNNLIFSSTAALFGEPQVIPIPESHTILPINPYGRTKAMVESILCDYWNAYGLSSVALRYFNAAGADPDGELGERHQPETHLIPLVLQAASGRRENIAVYGTDYDTPDGTCIRDYIHVTDLCEAHLLALNALLDDPGCRAYNLGNGQGFSVQQVIDTARAVTGKRIEVSVQSRRAGDPARLVADAGLARAELGWRPAYPSLEDIIQHAWTWEQKMAGGEVPGSA